MRTSPVWLLLDLAVLVLLILLVWALTQSIVTAVIGGVFLWFLGFWVFIVMRRRRGGA